MMNCSHCNKELVTRKYAKGYCLKCYDSVYKGYVLQADKISKRNYILNGEGILTSPNGEKYFIDLDDFEKFKNVLWCSVNGKWKYAHNSKLGMLHKVVSPQFEMGDHIDRNIFNNHKSNIREGIGGINQRNRGTWGKIKYKGVVVSKDRKKKFIAQVNYKNKITYLGSAYTPEDAYKIVLTWAKDKNLLEYYEKV